MKIALIALLVVLIAAPAGLYFTGMLQIGGGVATASGDEEGGEEQEEEGEHGEAAVPQYLTLDPPFVVNFVHRGTLRYLQVSLDVQYDDVGQLTRITDRMPEVRNALILLFSNQEYETLSTLEGKELLRDQILLAINEVLGLKPEDKKAKGEVFITNFVMQ